MMTLHRLHAGDGYTYLTRQVASGDREITRGQNLADYYVAEGTPPGLWIGKGIDDLGLTGQVSEEQMRALFGEGLHPNADLLFDQAIAAGMSPKAAIEAQKLGRAFPKFKNDVEFVNELNSALEAHRIDTGKAPTRDERDALRFMLAAKHFHKQHGQSADTKGELVRFMAAQESKIRQPVAGYDLVFTPVKSVSVLWGLGDDEVRTAIEQAHKDAVNETLAWIESEAALTRRGTAGVEQIDTHGLVIAQFDHFDNRNGDPNLHTHCAVSNKVRGIDGNWSSLDARVLHRIAVAGAARYNRIVADKISRALPVAFEDRSRGENKQPVREIAGVPQELLDGFSRRPQIMERANELMAEYRAEHGKNPSKVVQISLVQRATLETRSGKQTPKSLVAMREEWREQAMNMLGADGIDNLLSTALSQDEPFIDVTEFDADQVASAAVERVSLQRSTWTEANVRTVAEDMLSRVKFPSEEQASAAVELVVNRALHRDSLLVDISLDQMPEAMTRANGESTLTDHQKARYTSTAMLDAEQRLLGAAHTPTVFTVSDSAFETALAYRENLEGRPFNKGQIALARHLATSEALLAVGIGPAGTGKTTSMKAVTDAWQAQGRDVIALGPSAAAATVLGEDIGVRGRTIDDILTRHRLGIDVQINRGAMLLVDESGMASTHQLDALVQIAAEHGALVRLIGDPAQLSAVNAGGALGLLARDTRAPELEEVVRFSDDDEREISLALRKGEHSVIEWYEERDRLIGGSRDELLDRILRDHLADTAAGSTSVMLAPTTADVQSLNQAAQAIHLVNGTLTDGARTALTAGDHAYVGDTIVTRRNQNNITAVGGTRAGQRVENGDLWTVQAITEHGIIAVHKRHGGTVTLPNWYLTQHTELGYAHTIHRAQGMTVDVARSLLGASVTREAGYVALTRGRHGNYAYLVTDELPDGDLDHQPDPVSTRSGVLAEILDRRGEEISATEQLREALDRASDPARFQTYYDVAVTKLGTDYALHLLDRSLPATILATAKKQDGFDSLVARVRELATHGADIAPILAAATDRELATVGNIPGALLGRLKAIETPELADDQQAILPPVHRGSDQTLREFATRMREQIGSSPTVTAADFDGLRPVDLEYTHPQQSAYNAALARIAEGDAATLLEAALPEHVVEAIRDDGQWTPLLAAVADAEIHGGRDPYSVVATITEQGPERLAGYGTALLERLRTLDDTTPADSALPTTREPIAPTDRALAAYATELRDYLDTLDSPTSRPETPQPQEAARTTTPARTIEPSPITRREKTRPETPQRRTEPRPAITRDPRTPAAPSLTGLRALSGAKLVDARRHIAAKQRHLEQLRSLTAATRAAALSRSRTEAVRREHTRITAPAHALTQAQAAIEARIEAVHRVDTAIDGARTELAGTGRLARTKRAELEAKINALAAERAAALEELTAARTAAETIAPANQWDKIANDATEADKRLPEALREAEERDRQALNTADKTLERIDTQQQKLARQDTAITGEQTRRRELTPEQSIVETTQREQQATEKGSGQLEAKERNNHAMMLARQREHTDQQKHRGRDTER
ncbi:MobF family relaxase [Rhodococcus qingshengii]|uniref:MobF family relaxase n=1 Tax=Rhodococcus qingshengii TaxID=334542 RepID=UPI0024BAEF05|nr:MobF family relaxase [Rhodococcus qingshengii]